MESVQLDTGQSDPLGFFSQSKDLLIEIGATLGYSLGVHGRVARWHIDHWIKGIAPPGKMQIDEVFEDASKITAEMVRRDVVTFLRGAIANSYRAPDASSRIGFVMQSSLTPANSLHSTRE